MPRPDPLPADGAPVGCVPPFETPEQELEVLREALAHAERVLKVLVKERDGLLAELRRANIRPQARLGRRKPPEAGLPVPAVPPRGPLPMQGGAEAPLDFSAD